ncbi:unnamed protein product [Ectocarpus fasciculatus]
MFYSKQAWVGMYFDRGGGLGGGLEIKQRRKGSGRRSTGRGAGGRPGGTMPLKEGNTPWFHFDPVLFLPLWIGIWRWGAYLILKGIPSLLYKPIPISEELEQGHLPVSTQMMTMIIPVYMPEPGFEECLQSWVDNRPKTIVIVVDTNSYQQVLNIVETVNPRATIIRVVEESKPGKRAAMYTGLAYVDTEITVFADDDALYGPAVLKSLIMPFKDPAMGGCGTRQIARPKADKFCFSDIMMDMRLYQRYLEYRATTFMGGGSTCLSGRTMAYRTQLFRFDGFKNYFLNEHFAGQLQLSGDDKCLTRLCIMSDYKMWHQICEVCTLSTQFEEGAKLRAQLLRWSRNSWRSDIKMLFLERSVWRKYPWLAVTSLDKMISPFTMVYGPMAVLFYAFWEQNMFILVAFACYILVTRVMKTVMYFTWSRPRPPCRWFWYIGPFIFVQYWGAVIKLYALCTLKDRRWGNREVKVNAQNEIVRTGEFEDAEEEEGGAAVKEVPPGMSPEEGSEEWDEQEYEQEGKHEYAGDVGLEMVDVDLEHEREAARHAQHAHQYSGGGGEVY